MSCTPPLFSRVTLTPAQAACLTALDDVCTQFFHNTPAKIKYLAQPMFGSTEGCASACLTAIGQPLVSGPGFGYRSLQDGKEMFIARHSENGIAQPGTQSVPWPIAPPRFQPILCNAIKNVFRHIAMSALCQLLDDVLLSPPQWKSMSATEDVGGHHTAGQTTGTELLRGVPMALMDAASVLFARHYRHATKDGSEDDDGGTPQCARQSLIDAHTDSGILTVVYVPHRSAVGHEFGLEFMSPHDNMWHAPATPSCAGELGGRSVDVVVTFAGEMLCPFVLRLLDESCCKMPLGARSRIEECLSRLAAVHRVRRTEGLGDAVPPSVCRHSYAYQLRVPLDWVRGGHHSTGTQSKATHKIVQFC